MRSRGLDGAAPLAPRRAATRGILALLFLLAWPGLLAARADGETPVERAKALIKALDGRDHDAFGAMAADLLPDRWRVAEELCLSSRHDVALALVAAGGPELAELAPYVRARKTRKPHAGVRKALEMAEAASDEAALTTALKALDGVSSKGDAFECARVLLSRAEVARALRRSAHLAAAFEAAASSAEDLGWLHGARTAWIAAGFVSMDDLEYGATERAWLRWNAIEQRRRSSMQANALMNLGSLCGQLGDFEGALRYYGDVLAFSRKEGLSTDFVHLYMGITQLRRGAYGEARHHAEQALTSFAADVPARGKVLMLLGEIEEALGRHEEALAIHERALRHYERLRDAGGASQGPIALELGRCLGSIAITSFRLGRHSAARDLLIRAIATFQALGADADQANAHLNLGWQAYKQGRFQESHDHYARGLAIARRIQDAHRECHLLQNEAETFAAEGKLDTAFERHAEALKIAKQLDSIRALRDAKYGLAQLHLRKGEAQAAFDHAREASELMSQMLTGLAEGQAAEAREHNAELLQLTMEAALSLGKPEAVCYAIESSRAVAFLEALEGREALREAVVPAALQKLEGEARKAEAAARFAYESARRTRTLGEQRNRRALLTAARQRTAHVVERIRREARRASSLLYPQPASLGAVQRTLRPGDALVSYVLSGEAAHALVVRADDARIVKLGPTADIRELVEAYQAADQDPAADKQLRTLAARVVEPLGLGKNVKRVVVSPDGALFVAPFGALMTDREIVLAPSATSYGVLAATAFPEGRGVLALGGVDYNDKRRLPGLPATRAEAEHVGSITLLGEQATEAALRAAIEQHAPLRALHLACHGLPDADVPLRSSLALTRAGDGDMGYLTASEVLRMRIPAELAVLSACQTGRGRVYRGEGLLGLPRAFLFAGPPRVIVSLWKVDDEATQALMIKFYELWSPKGAKKGLGAAAALKRAQESIRGHEDHPEWKHPYYWAAWVLWGLPD